MSVLALMSRALLITYTLFPDVTPATKTERADVPWEALVDNIRKAPTYINKAACPLISMGEYGDARTDKDCLRHAANVQRVFGIEIDYDGEQMPIEEAAATLQRAAVCSVLYTSPSHTPAAPRWRALLPLSEPALPDKRREYVARANRILGGVATRESFTLSQSFYLGRVRGAEYIVIDTEGRYIDLAADIEPQYFVGGSNDGETSRDATTDAQLRECFDNGAGRYEAMLKLSARWAARGMPADDIESNLLALLGAGSINHDGIDLRTRARPMADSAVRKFGDSRGAPARIEPQAEPQQEPPPHPTEATEDEQHPARKPMRWAELDGKEPPARIWRLAHWLSIGPTLLAGRGGTGKSLVAQTLATALVIGQNYLDEVTSPLKVLAWFCEDDHDELWRRQIAICSYFGVSLADLVGKLVIESRLGCENTLFAPVYGTPQWTPLRDELRDQMHDYGADLLIADNTSQLFGCNENDRHEVTSFVNGMVGLVPDRPTSQLILSHPAKAGDSEFSGSTAWENAVRMRWFMGATLPDQEEPEEGHDDPNVRYIAKRKTNYSVKDYRKLVFDMGVFKPENAPGDVSARYNYALRKEGAEVAVLSAVTKFAAQSIRVVDAPNSPDSLVAKMRAAKLMQDYSRQELGDAIAALRLAGRLIEAPVGMGSNRTAKMGLKVFNFLAQSECSK